MKVLVDTCVWSKVLRYKDPDLALTKRLNDLVNDGRVVLIGPIRQEILSGIANPKQFRELKEILDSFEDVSLGIKHFVRAAEFNNICRSKGVQGSTIDFLICAVASIENLIVFTTDKDFNNYKKYLPIKLVKL